MIKEHKIFIGFKLTWNQWCKRNEAWCKHGKIKNGKFEFFKDFDRRVFFLGLKAMGELK